MTFGKTVFVLMLCDVSRFNTAKNILRINHSNTVIRRFIIRSEIPKNVNCVLHPSVFGRSYLEKTITYPRIFFDILYQKELNQSFFIKLQKSNVADSMVAYVLNIASRCVRQDCLANKSHVKKTLAQAGLNGGQNIPTLR